MDKTRTHTTKIGSYHVIFVPGLGNSYWFYRFATSNWHKKGLSVHFLPLAWEKGARFDKKLQRILTAIDTLSQTGTVSLIGASAGGSAVINAYYKRKTKVARVICICARLHEGNGVFPSLSLAAASSPAFKKSVRLCERNLKKLTLRERKRILTIRPLFDEIVPVTTMLVPEGTNTPIPTIGHMPSIALAITMFSNDIVSFLRIPKQISLY